MRTIALVSGEFDHVRAQLRGDRASDLQFVTSQRWRVGEQAQRPIASQHAHRQSQQDRRIDAARVGDAQPFHVAERIGDGFGVGAGRR